MQHQHLHMNHIHTRRNFSVDLSSYPPIQSGQKSHAWPKEPSSLGPPSIPFPHHHRRPQEMAATAASSITEETALCIQIFIIQIYIYQKRKIKRTRTGIIFHLLDLLFVHRSFLSRFVGAHCSQVHRRRHRLRRRRLLPVPRYLCLGPFRLISVDFRFRLRYR